LTVLWITSRHSYETLTFSTAGNIRIRGSDIAGYRDISIAVDPPKSKAITLSSPVKTYRDVEDVSMRLYEISVPTLLAPIAIENAIRRFEIELDEPILDETISIGNMHGSLTMVEEPIIDRES